MFIGFMGPLIDDYGGGGCVGDDGVDDDDDGDDGAPLRQCPMSIPMFLCSKFHVMQV